MRYNLFTVHCVATTHINNNSVQQSAPWQSVQPLRGSLCAPVHSGVASHLHLKHLEKGHSLCSGTHYNSEQQHVHVSTLYVIVTVVLLTDCI
jgi:hypothetical protein